MRRVETKSHRPPGAYIRAALAFLAVAVALAACGPEGRESGPRTGSPQLAAEFVSVADGSRLPLRRWRADGPPHAVILGVHGFNDYSNAFAAAAANWAAAGVVVYSFDQRGFGASDAPGIWPGAATMVDDLADVAAAVAERHPGLPVYVVGVSMGGAVAMVGLADRRLSGVAGTVLVAPAVWARETMPLSHRAALWLAARTVPWLRLGGRGLGIRPSDNVEMLRALGADPLIVKETRVDTMQGVVDLMDRAYAAAPAVVGPVLLLYGANDEIIPREPTSSTVCRRGGPWRVGVYRDGWHMLLRDLQAEVVHTDILAWIDDPAAPLPSGAEEEARRFFACPGEQDTGVAGAFGPEPE